MEKITLENKYTKCSYCYGLVYANEPTCSKCGLEMSSEGISELAEIEEFQINSLEDLRTARNLSFAAMGLTIIGYFGDCVNQLLFSTGFLFLFYIFFWGGILQVVIRYFLWKWKYDKDYYNIEDEATINEYKTSIFLNLSFNAIIAYFLYYVW